MSSPTVAPGPARTRISPLRVAVLLLCTVLIGWFGTRAISSAVTPVDTPGPTYFSGYVDVTNTPSYPFETPPGPAQSNVTLAFVVSGPDDPCAPMWGGAYTLDTASSDLDLDRRIAQLRLVGGQARVSFGGQAGTELASTCTDPTALADAYQSVVDRYELTSIDLDLEGTSQGDAAAAARRAGAIKVVQDRASSGERPLAVWLTLPVGPTGLTTEGEAVLAGMLSAGVDVAGVNGMTMDFGSAESPARPMSAQVIEASTALHAQVRAAFAQAGRSLDDAQGWAKVGITPMIGQNDVQAEQFTLTDAAAVNDFARAHGVGQMSMWSLNRDSTCAAPLPAILPVVQNSCSGIDQGGQRFADVLSADLGTALPSGSASADTVHVGHARSGDPVADRDGRRPRAQPLPDLGPAGAVPGWHQGRLAPPGLRCRLLDQRRRPRHAGGRRRLPLDPGRSGAAGRHPCPPADPSRRHLSPVGPDPGVRRDGARAGRAGAL